MPKVTFGKTEMDMKPILIAGRELIANGFTTGAYARDEFGQSVPVTSDMAKCFCTLGALRRAVYDAGINYHNDYDVFPMLKSCFPFVESSEFPGADAIKFNDHHSKEEVLQAWDTAIAKCD